MEQAKRPRKVIDKSIFKLIVFYERVENSVELIVRLKNDGFNGAKFFRSVVEAYLSYDPKFMEWFNTKRKTPKNRIKKIEKLVEDGRRLESEYYLSNEEVENIFDIIENIEDIEY